eukprot:scaffold4138_cov46-Phaeocystis_antarctica.AAC.2
MDGLSWRVECVSRRSTYIKSSRKVHISPARSRQRQGGARRQQRQHGAENDNRGEWSSPRGASASSDADQGAGSL